MGQRGQANVEWIAVVLVVACLFAGAGAGFAALGLPNRHQESASQPDALVSAYGAEVAVLVRRHRPGLVYEDGLHDVPVDPRACRAIACARRGVPVLFTHVVRRGGTTYIQYWAYYPDSSWHGVAGRHADDWESVQLRINPDGTIDARASAHHGYTGRRFGPDLNVNQVDSSLVPARWRRGWTRWSGWLHVARHSHAGYLTKTPGDRRFDPPARVTLIPLETVSASLPQGYAVTPPWRKGVYADPESPAT